jgi:Holliday junction resolvasome RuvABC endonuclease subunit
VIQAGSYRPAGRSLDDKLYDCYDWFNAEFFAERLNVLAIELPIYHKNVKTLRTLAQLAGVLRLAAADWSERTIEILPAERRLALGIPINMKGAEAKQHILRNVNALFDLGLTPEQHDIADAVAVAMAARKKIREKEWIE